MLRSRRSRQEEAFANQTPEPAAAGQAAVDPEEEVLMGDSVGLALLVVLDHLTPAERVAFVLHDMFGFTFEEISPVVDRTADATRQLANRARRRVRGATEASRLAGHAVHQDKPRDRVGHASQSAYEVTLRTASPPPLGRVDRADGGRT